jgi:hypothetical protein
VRILLPEVSLMKPQTLACHVICDLDTLYYCQSFNFCWSFNFFVQQFFILCQLFIFLDIFYFVSII